MLKIFTVQLPSNGAVALVALTYPLLAIRLQFVKYGEHVISIHFHSFPFISIHFHSFPFISIHLGVK